MYLQLLVSEQSDIFSMQIKSYQISIGDYNGQKLRDVLVRILPKITNVNISDWSIVDNENCGCAARYHDEENNRVWNVALSFHTMLAEGLLLRAMSQGIEEQRQIMMDVKEITNGQ